MSLYQLSVVLHILAVLIWFGHMFFWSFVIGPVTKRIEPRETGLFVRESSLRFGGLGWPALAVLGLTGILMLYYRGVTLEQVLSGEFFHDPFGRGLGIKLIFVGGMMLYQTFVGHRPAPRLIYLNMLAALVIVAISILLVRAPFLFAFGDNFRP
jgi:hypothetical protein